MRYTTCMSASHGMEFYIGPISAHQPFQHHLCTFPCTPLRTYLESPKITVRYVTFKNAAIAP